MPNMDTALRENKKTRAEKPKTRAEKWEGCVCVWRYWRREMRGKWSQNTPQTPVKPKSRILRSCGTSATSPAPSLPLRATPPRSPVFGTCMGGTGSQSARGRGYTCRAGKASKIAPVSPVPLNPRRGGGVRRGAAREGGHNSQAERAHTTTPRAEIGLGIWLATGRRWVGKKVGDGVGDGVGDSV